MTEKKDFLPSEDDIKNAQKEFAINMVIYLVELANKFRLAAKGECDFNEALDELTKLVRVANE